MLKIVKSIFPFFLEKEFSDTLIQSKNHEN